MKRDALIDAVFSNLELDEEHAFRKDEAIEAVSQCIEIDIEHERKKVAKRIVERRMRLGQTEPCGQLNLGLEGVGEGAFSYEPRRFLKVDDDRLVEQDNALVGHKETEWNSAKVNLGRVAKWERRKRQEYNGFAKWAKEQRIAGRDEGELTFGAYILAAGLWQQEISAAVEA